MKDMKVISGINTNSLTVEQKRKAPREVNLIKLKCSGKLKVGMCANGASHRKFVTREEKNSRTITLEGLLSTMVIDAYEVRKVANFDISGAYLQTDSPK